VVSEWRGRDNVRGRSVLFLVEVNVLKVASHLRSDHFESARNRDWDSAVSV
jgi:hypothetical protein